MSSPLQGPSAAHTPTRRHTDARHLIQPTDSCKVCGATAAELAALLQRFNLTLPLVLASVFAEPDICSGCCMDLGRSTWAEAKRGIAQRSIAEGALGNSKGAA